MIRISLRRPVSTIVASATLCALGALSLLRLPVSLLPRIERPKLLVAANAPGLSREELLRTVTEPLEQRLSSLSGVRSIASETGDGAALVTVTTEWQTDAEKLRAEATRNLEGTLPAELSLTVAGGDVSPVLTVVVTGEPASRRDLFVRRVLEPELSRLPGAGRVEVIGEMPTRVVVRPLLASLAARGLVVGDVIDRLERVGRSVPAGRVRDGGGVRPVVIHEPVHSLEQLAALRVMRGTVSVPLSEIAKISIEPVDSGSGASVNGRTATAVRIFRSPAANAVTLAAAARERIERLSRSAGAELPIAVAEDRSLEVIGAVRELVLSALIGLLLGTAVLRLMLGRFAPTLALSLVIPASLLVSFTLFDLAGVPLDLVSLAGLALAAGMLVDNSVVVLEAIESARARGESDPEYSGTRRVAVAVAAGCFAHVVVFVPFVYLHGLARAFFGEQAFAVTVALLASLLFSLTLTPVLAGRDRKPAKGRSPGAAFAARMLERALGSPRATLALGALAFGIAVAAFLLLPARLFPVARSKVVRLDYRLPPQLDAAEARRRGDELARLSREALAPLRARSELALRGLPEPGRSGVDASRGRIEWTFSERTEADRAPAKIAAFLRGLPDVDATVTLRPGELLEAATASGSEPEISLGARDDAALQRLSARIEAAFSPAKLIPLERGERTAAIALRLDRARLAEAGASPAAVEETVRRSLGGTLAGRVELSGIEPEIEIGAPIPEAPELLPIRIGADKAERTVPLSALGRLEPQERPARVLREDGRVALRRIVRAAPGTRLDARQLERKLRALPLGAGESVRLAGEALEVSAAFRQLRMVLLLSLLLVFLVIAAFYESIAVPLIVLATIPVSAAGALSALALTGQSLDLMSLLGLVLLGGIVANNAIVLVDRTEQLRSDGVPEEEALRLAGAERYRPILMTTATTFLGMLPLALLGGEGVELRRSLATAVLGGLATSTAASLLLAPVVHRALEPMRRRRGGAV